MTTLCLSVRARELTVCIMTAVTLLGISACNHKPSLAKLSGSATILAFGDSLTFGTGVSSEYSYPSVLASLTGLRVVRSGIPGEQTSGGLQRLPGELAKHKPELVILGLGGNDILHRQNAVTIKSNLQDMINLIRQHSAQVLLLGIPDFGLIPDTADLYVELAEDMEVVAENQIIATLLRDHSMKSDTIHFNRQGYQKLAEAIHKKLIDAGALEK
jgi:acyl-CoA thioesterase I